MSRTVSARIPKELHDELRETCNKVGCAISDYVEEAIKFAMYGSTEFDFGWEDDEPISEKKLAKHPTIVVE